MKFVAKDILIGSAILVCKQNQKGAFSMVGPYKFILIKVQSFTKYCYKRHFHWFRNKKVLFHWLDGMISGDIMCGTERTLEREKTLDRLKRKRKIWF